MKLLGYIALILGIGAIVALVIYQGAGDVADALATVGWGCVGVETGINSGTGADNTILLAEQCPVSQGNGCQGDPSAAKYWNDLTWNGFSDWFLPNLYEAQQLDPNTITIQLSTQYFWIAEEAINGDCSYCNPENVARAWWPDAFGNGSFVDWFFKDTCINNF